MDDREAEDITIAGIIEYSGIMAETTSDDIYSEIVGDLAASAIRASQLEGKVSVDFLGSMMDRVHRTMPATLRHSKAEAATTKFIADLARGSNRKFYQELTGHKKDVMAQLVLIFVHMGMAAFAADAQGRKTIFDYYIQSILIMCALFCLALSNNSMTMRITGVAMLKQLAVMGKDLVGKSWSEALIHFDPDEARAAHQLSSMMIRYIDNMYTVFERYLLEP